MVSVYIATVTTLWLIEGYLCDTISVHHHSHYRLPNVHTFSDCDRIFLSSSLNDTFGSINGTFKGPDLPLSYPEQVKEIRLEESFTDGESNATTLVAPTAEELPSDRPIHTRQCLYIFIAGVTERVKLSFSKINLRSEAPECFDEYIDIYSEIEEVSTDLLSTPFGGRFCDEYIPHDRVSLFRTLVLNFYTEKEQVVGEKAFLGKYEFINSSYYVAGTPKPDEVCTYEIFSEQKREGEFMSPTYPGVYPKNTNCSYLFKGAKGQRVKLEFLDFDLFYGGPHCPLDYIKIYDGIDDQAPLINMYCGNQRQLMVFSSGTSLFFQFVSVDRMADSQNRGFSGFFEFSEKFVNLGFIVDNENTEHVPGTECDQRIMSRGQTNGSIYAPNYPFLYHQNTICKYFLYGLQDMQNLERINFMFEILKIPSKDESECSDAYVRLYTQSQAPDEFDYVFCGEAIPSPIVSDGPSLLIVFNSGTLQGQGFKANYRFETDYNIAGTQPSPGQCTFTYSSNSLKFGEFNSPRYPTHYPSNTYCTFEFYGEPGERVMIVFNHFKMTDSTVTNTSMTGYNDGCQQDWLEIYSGNAYGQEHFIGRYCSNMSPGPFVTEKGFNQVRIVMNTDEAEVSSGFAASYGFINSSETKTTCGGNFMNLESGIITSPGYPGYTAVQHLCDWNIVVRQGRQILLQFDVFSVEGDQASRGCSGAVVRVYTEIGGKSIELCGSSLDDSSKQFISKSNKLQLTFTSDQKSVGTDGFMADGFLAIWTEISKPRGEIRESTIAPNSPGGQVNQSLAYNPCTSDTSVSIDSFSFERVNTKGYFYCAMSGYCISKKLQCNDVNNCGIDDNSDEIDCVKEVQANLMEVISSLAGLTLFSIFSLGVVILTAFLIFSWYSRSLNEIKRNSGKDCHRHFVDGSQSNQDYSPYFASDVTGTPHRIVEVMTVSSTGGLSNHTKLKWPTTSNSVETNVSETLDPDYIDNEDILGNVPSSNTSMQTSLQIPPPPPPPAISVGRAAMLGPIRQSSVGGGFVSFTGGDSFVDETGFGGSFTSIEQSSLVYPSTSAHYRSETIGLSGAMSATLSRLPQSTGMAQSTFGYPYHSLAATHSPFSGYGQIRRSQQHLSQVIPTNQGTLQSNSMDVSNSNMNNLICGEGNNGTNGNGTDDDTEMSLQLGGNNSLLNESTDNCGIIDRDMNMMMMLFDKNGDEDDLTEQETSLTRKYQLRPAKAMSQSNTTTHFQTGGSFGTDSLLLD